jgi:SAM-dependent methyltransferase
MKQATRNLLHALNLHFYETHAQDFSRTRERPWRGCERVLERVCERMALRAPSVLDVGCGNGRLLALLRARFPQGFSYTGVDASAGLLALAAQRFGEKPESLRFMQADFVASEPEQALPAGAFDCVALFGVMHHVPGEQARRDLLAAAARRLAPNGILAFTLWRFDESDRFAGRRLLSGTAPALRGGAAIPGEVHAISFEGGDVHADLDPGDHLLYWGQGKHAVRYCHVTDEAELARWLDGLDLDVIDRFRADGSGERMNDYVLLGCGQRQAAPAGGRSKL